MKEIIIEFFLKFILIGAFGLLFVFTLPIPAQKCLTTSKWRNFRVRGIAVDQGGRSNEKVADTDKCERKKANDNF